MINLWHLVLVLMIGLMPSLSQAKEDLPSTDPGLEQYQSSDMIEEVGQPDPQWLAENRDVLDENIQAIHAADRALQSEKTSMYRLMEVAQDCDQPGKWLRESERTGQDPDNVVSFSEAEVYKNARTPYFVKITKSTCSGDMTDTSYYYYRKDKSLAYLYEVVDTYAVGANGANTSKPIHVERHIYYNQSGKQVARFEKTTDAKSGQIATDSTSAEHAVPKEYLKAKSLPFFGLL